MRGWSVALALLGALPPAVVGWAGLRCADSLGSQIGAAVASVAGWPPPSREPAPTLVAPDPDALAAHDALGPLAGPGASPTSAAVAAGRSAPDPRSTGVPARGIRVRADTVLRLASAGLRPQGFPVPATAWRPAGIALSGVAALGIGLRDGDVLTRAAGRPALEPGDVIGFVIASRGAGVPEISGRFWRNGEPWNLVVEQPYLHPRSPAVNAVVDPETSSAEPDAERVAPASRPAARAKRRSRPALRKGRAAGPSVQRHGPQVGAASRAGAGEQRGRG
jgi:hypothetical protein